MSDETSAVIYQYILKSAKARIANGESEGEELKDRKLVAKCLRKLYLEKKKC